MLFRKKYFLNVATYISANFNHVHLKSLINAPVYIKYLPICAFQRLVGMEWHDSFAAFNYSIPLDVFASD